MINKLDKIYERAKKINIDDNAKIFIMSDCHRGIGNNYDNFIKNKKIFISALEYYYKKNFIYIELGDGDDMWEVKNYEDIIETHIDSFKQLKRFNDAKRLIMIYGNHDIIKKYPNILKKYFYEYNNIIEKKIEPLLKDIIVYEALILKYNNHDIFLLHGHQVDIINSTFWRLSRFLVRCIWRLLEHNGLKDLTGDAKNYKVPKHTDKTLETWSKKNNKILIAGHTHRAIFPKLGQSLYFNDGSCIHPNGITCLEIENGMISLVRWEYEITKKNLIQVKRKILECKEPIKLFYNR